MHQQTEYAKMFAIEDFLPEYQARISQYICHLCQGVSHDPLVHKDGQLYCKQCVYKAMEDKTLLVDKQDLFPVEIHDTLFPSIFVNFDKSEESNSISFVIKLNES